MVSDVDDEYEDEEDPWEEGAEDILEKGMNSFKRFWMYDNSAVVSVCNSNSLIRIPSYFLFLIPKLPPRLIMYVSVHSSLSIQSS